MLQKISEQSSILHWVLQYPVLLVESYSRLCCKRGGVFYLLRATKNPNFQQRTKWLEIAYENLL